jgi:hypothetical protein
VNNQHLTVRQNLFDFLTMACQSPSFCGDSTYLWIDQICIDQSRDVEKGHQVAQLLQIFLKATSVFVWLGQTFDGSDALMEATH